jgi:predicted Zn-dependent protease
MRGNTLVRLHRAADAIPLAREALKLDSKSPDAHMMLGRALEQLGQDGEAIKELEQAANTDTDGSLHYVLFNLYRKIGERERAKQALLTSNRLKERAQVTSAGNAALEGSILGFQQ